MPIPLYTNKNAIKMKFARRTENIILLRSKILAKRQIPRYKPTKKKVSIEIKRITGKAKSIGFICSTGIVKLNLKLKARIQEKLTAKKSCKKAKSIFMYFFIL